MVRFLREITGDSQLRWIGTDKGAMHLATAAVVNAVWDLWPKSERKPVWKQLADMSPADVVRCIDFRYITDAITPDEALAILKRLEPTKREREDEMRRDGFPAYTTSAGWLGYSDEKIRARCREAVNPGWTHVEVKGGRDIEDDMRRARRRSLRVRAAHLALRLHRGIGIPSGPGARVRGPPARAFRRPGHHKGRPLYAADKARLQHRDESPVAPRVRVSRRCRMVIDAHHHFWDPAKASYPWMTEALAPIRRRFGPEDLEPLLAANGIDQTILVQTRSSLDETREFLATAAQHDFIAGVVGWVDLTGNVPEQLKSLRARPGGAKLVGVR